MFKIYRLEKNIYSISRQGEEIVGNISIVVGHLLNDGIKASEIRAAFTNMFSTGDNVADFGINGCFIFSYNRDDV